MPVSNLGQEIPFFAKPSKSGLSTRSMRDLRSSLPTKQHTLETPHRSAAHVPLNSRLRTQHSQGHLVTHKVPPPSGSRTLLLTRENKSEPLAISPVRLNVKSHGIRRFSTRDIVEVSREHQTIEKQDQPPGPYIRRMHSDVGLSIHALRTPPVDPKKWRRYCTDFGLGRSEPWRGPTFEKSCELDDSSTASTPLATYTKTDSDTSSLYEMAQFEFPNPPDASPPSLSFAEIAYQNVKERTSKTDYYVRHSHLDLTGGALSRDLGLGFEDSECQGCTNIHCTNTSSPHVEHKDYINSTNHQKRNDRLLHSQSTLSLWASSVPLPRPRAISDTPDLDARLNENPIKPSESFYRLELSLNKLHSHATTISPVTINQETKSYTPSQLSFAPSLASAGRQKPIHRANTPVPLAGLRHSTPVGVPGVVDRSLATPFHHRTTRSQPIPPKPVAKASDIHDPTSFIDITPEQEIRRNPALGTRRERMRKLWARASHGVISWGKNLTRI